MARGARARAPRSRPRAITRRRELALRSFALAVNVKPARRDDGRAPPTTTVAMNMAAEVRWLLLAFLAWHAGLPCRAETPHGKFEYKYSFKPPYLAQKDGSVPFWEYGGSK